MLVDLKEEQCGWRACGKDETVEDEFREGGWVQSRQRLVRKGNDSDLDPMSNTTTWKGFRGGCHDSQVSQISLWLQQE